LTTAKVVYISSCAAKSDQKARDGESERPAHACTCGSHIAVVDAP